MFRKVIALALVLMGLVGIMIPAAMAETYTIDKYASPVTMYVYTENGGTLNVRSIPAVKDKTIIAKIPFGTQVTVLGLYSADREWAAIRYNQAAGGVAWVMMQFLTAAKPSQKDTDQAAIRHQMNTYRAVADTFLISARPSRDGGWVNLRTQPGTSADMITKLFKGQTLTVIGETDDWYKAIDSVTGRTGFVSKSFVVRLLK